jgi:hypothetical protein
MELNKDLFEPILSDVGTIVTIISLAFAIWQYTRNRKIKAFFEAQAMDLHQNIATALGAIQISKEKIDKPEVLRIELGRAEGLCQGLLHNSASNLLNVTDLSLDQVHERIADKRLFPQYAHIYIHLARNKKPRIIQWLRRIFF